jgi:hypothetical protein
MKDRLTPEEQQAALDRFAAEEDARYWRGRRIVTAIVACEITLTVLVFLLGLSSWITLILGIAFGLMLYHGNKNVRCFYVVSMGLTAGYGIYALATGQIWMEIAYLPKPLPQIAVGILVVYLLFCGASSVVLLVSKSVESFLYEQANG